MISGLFIVAAFVNGMFPQSLSRERITYSEVPQKEEEAIKKKLATLNDLEKTIKKLFQNKILMANTIASIFYTFGILAFGSTLPKYIEVQFRQTASSAR